MEESIDELISILRYKENLSIPEIAKKLNLSKVSLYSWIENGLSLKNKRLDLLRRLTKKRDIEKYKKEIRLILRLVDLVEDKDWKDFLFGLQENLNVEQAGLLDKADLKNDFHVSEWISGKRIPSRYKKFKLMELAYKHNQNPKDLIKLGARIRSSIKIDDKWVEAGAVLNNNSFKKDVFVLENEEVFLNIPLLFPKFRNKHPILFIPYNQKIAVFYNEKINTRPQPLILPALLKISDAFLVGLGVYVGEGSKNRKPKITNSEPLIINQAVKFFELFGISRSKLSAWIQLHERSSKSNQEVRDFWLKNTALKSENIHRIFIKKSVGSAKVKEYGTIHLEANFILLQLLIENLLKFAPILLKNLPAKKTIPFLQGIFAAEGSVEVTKSGVLRAVRFTSTIPRERKLVIDLLNNLGIKSHEHEKRFNLGICGYGNLKKLVNLDIFKYHPSRNEKLNEGFEKLEKSRKIIKT